MSDKKNNEVNKSYNINSSFVEVGSQAVKQVKVGQCICECTVPAAPSSVIGTCEYYYLTYINDPIKQAENKPPQWANKNGINIRYFMNFKQVQQHARGIHASPTMAQDIINRIKNNKEKLLGNKGSWSRWLNFKERHKECGHEPPEYYISYGYYYCSRFSAYLQPSFKTAEAKQWLTDARRYLQAYMDNGLTNQNTKTVIKFKSKLYPNNPTVEKEIRFKGVKEVELNNEIFKNFAFLSHVPAYLDANLKRIPLEDLIKIWAEPNLQEWMDKGTWDQAIDVATIVYPNWKPFVLGVSVLLGPFSTFIASTAIAAISLDQREREKGLNAK